MQSSSRVASLDCRTGSIRRAVAPDTVKLPRCLSSLLPTRPDQWAGIFLTCHPSPSAPRPGPWILLSADAGLKDGVNSLARWHKKDGPDGSLPLGTPNPLGLELPGTRPQGRLRIAQAHPNPLDTVSKMVWGPKGPWNKITEHLGAL